MRTTAPLRATPDEIRAWLTAAAEATFPLAGDARPERVRVLLDPRATSEPVPFGETRYEDGPALHLVVGRDAPGAAFPGEWVAVHEMVHLSLPRVADAPWFAEGLATYYQEILRGRAGMLAPDECLRRLRAGFARGRAQAGQATLRDDAVAMSRTHRYMRVYRSGAAIALLWDTALRRDHATTLDDVLRRCSATHRPGTRRFSLRELLDCMQAGLGEPVLDQIAARWLNSTEFPDVDAALALPAIRGPHPGAEKSAPGSSLRGRSR